MSFETEGWRESRSGAEGVGTIDLKPSEMVNGWVWYFLKHKKGIARKLHPFYSYRITRTAKLSRRKSLQAAQKKQEMKAEETGSAHRKLCQCFEHSNRKDIMGEDVKKKMGKKVFRQPWWQESHQRSNWEVFLEAIVYINETGSLIRANKRCWVKADHASPLQHVGPAAHRNKTDGSVQNRRPVQFRHHQIWYIQ